RRGRMHHARVQWMLDHNRVRPGLPVSAIYALPVDTSSRPSAAANSSSSRPYAFTTPSRLTPRFAVSWPIVEHWPFTSAGSSRVADGQHAAPARARWRAANRDLTGNLRARAPQVRDLASGEGGIRTLGRGTTPTHA